MRKAIAAAFLAMVTAVAGIPVGAAPPDRSRPADLLDLPDLVPLPVGTFWIEGADIFAPVGDWALATAQGENPYPGSATESLRIGTTVVNHGAHSLELLAVPHPNGAGAEPVRIAASQCVDFDAPSVDGAERACLRQEALGTLAFHPTHGHLHIPGFLRFRLLRDRNGKPARNGEVARAYQSAVCVADKAWQGAPDPDGTDRGWYRECRHTELHGPPTLRQGISPGWASSTLAAYPGQHLVITDVPDGVYWLEVTVNTGEGAGGTRIRESDLRNNTSLVRLSIKTKPDESKREAHPA